MKFELSPEDCALLNLSLGIAIGATCADRRKLSCQIIKLANTVNKNTPYWIPYEVEPPEAPATDPPASPSSPQDGAPKKETL